jgi:hypothetical protein
LRRKARAGSNRQEFSGRPIVPERLRGTPQATELQMQHALGQIFTPYAAYVRSGRAPEPGSDFARTMLRGPLDVPRAMGYRAVNIEGEAASRVYGAQEEASAEYAGKMDLIERAYVATHGTGRPNDFRPELQRILAEEGPKPAGDVITERLNSPRVQRMMLQERLRNEPDPARQRALRERIKRLQAIELQKSRERVPRAARPGLPPPVVQPLPAPPPDMLELQPLPAR